jgi:hypothetical protein
MAFQIEALQVDLQSDRASVVLADRQANSHVMVQVRIEAPGSQPENRLKDVAKDAARLALKGALDALA